MTAILLPIGWGGLGLMGLAFPILLIGLIVLLARAIRTTPHAAGEPAIRLLEERYARGEITREDFLERRGVLEERPDAGD